MRVSRRGLALIVFAESFSISNRFAQTHGSQLWLAGVPSSAREELERDDFYQQLGAEHVVPTIDEAVAAPRAEALPIIPRG